jgi:hypothetical protein
MIEFKTAPIDIKQFTIKPSDIGYETEAALELSPTARQAYGKTAQQKASGNTRPPIMLHPGE